MRLLAGAALVLLVHAVVCVSSQANVTAADSPDTEVGLGDRSAYHSYRRPQPATDYGKPHPNPGGQYGSGGYPGNSYENHGHQQGAGGSYHGGSAGAKHSNLRLDYAWKRVDFVFPSAAARAEAIRTGRYNYTQVIPLDVDVWEKGNSRKVFITLPADTAGVPVTLATVSEQRNSNAPLLAPYPDWSWHRREDCTGIASVYRVAIDDHDRLWVLDRGNETRKCKPQLVVFDLHNDRFLDRYQLPSSVYKQDSILITPIVDSRDHGRNVFVYIADVTTYALIVYDHQRKTSWRVNHPLFRADPPYGTFNIAGSTFTLMDGIFGMALSPLRCNGRHCDDRTLYFHPLASNKESYVKTSVLRNPENFRNGQNKEPTAFRSFEHPRPSQSAAEAMSEEGVLFSGLLPELAITCWNRDTPFAGWNLEVVARDPETLQFTSGMKVRYGRLWVVSCRYQRFITNTMNWNEVNYRVQSARVSDLIRGTKCDLKSNSIG